MTPDGKTLYVAAVGPGWGPAHGFAPVTPVNVTTGRAGRPIRVAHDPDALAVTPDSRTLYIADGGGNTVIPVSVRTGRPGRPIRAGAVPTALAITPNGQTLYVASPRTNTVTPVSVASGKPGPPIVVGHAPVALAITPNGRTLYVAIDGDRTPDFPGAHYVVPIDVATGRRGHRILVGRGPGALAISPDGRMLYVACQADGTTTPVVVATGRPLPPHPGRSGVDGRPGSLGGVTQRPDPVRREPGDRHGGRDPSAPALTAGGDGWPS